MGEGKFEQFSESLCHLKRLKNLNDLAKVLYRYFKQESNIELHSDVKVIFDMDEKEKSILKNWQNAACGFSNNLTKAESLGEIHEALLKLRLDVQKKLPSIFFILIGLFYKAMFLDNADIAGLLEEYIREGRELSSKDSDREDNVTGYSLILPFWLKMTKSLNPFMKFRSCILLCVADKHFKFQAHCTKRKSIDYFILLPIVKVLILTELPN